MMSSVQKSGLIAFRLPLRAAGLLDEAARQQGTSRSQYVRRALALALLRDCAEPPPPEAPHVPG
jgi:uncharacterized protein (DUF1778 family)